MTRQYERRSYKRRPGQESGPGQESEPRLALFTECPKCRGQYQREGYACICHQCAFEWGLLDSIEDVLSRALHRHRGELPGVEVLGVGPAPGDDVLHAEPDEPAA